MDATDGAYADCRTTLTDAPGSPVQPCPNRVCLHATLKSQSSSLRPHMAVADFPIYEPVFVIRAARKPPL